jgi:hypothetical protein
LTTSWKWFRVYWNKDHKGSAAGSKQWSTVQLQTFFTGPKSAVYYFCVMVPGTGAEEGPVADQRGRSRCQLIDDIKEQWAYEKEQQEELQKVLADGLDKHETTNWLKRAGWTALPLM